jgi:hypothetical protein
MIKEKVFFEETKGPGVDAINGRWGSPYSIACELLSISKFNPSC